MILGFLGSLSNVWLKQVKTANRNQWYDIQETILIHSSMKAIGVVEDGADTVLDVCIAGAEFCKPIRMQRYLCGSGCTAGVFFVQVLSEKGKPWYTMLKRI